MLYEFLQERRAEILALCQQKLTLLSNAKSSSAEMKLGLPVFYDELIEILRADELSESRQAVNTLTQKLHSASATRRGKESLELGYTISQVVHGYGALCQSITEYAEENRDKPIEAREFNRLNYCLDVAIAEAVTEFNRAQAEVVARAEIQRLGFLAHEMRNALNNIATTHQLLKKGLIGFGGSTSKLVESSITTMKDIIDRSLSEVRLSGEVNIQLRKCRIIDLVSEVEVTAMLEANLHSIQIIVEVDPALIVEVDRHLTISAIANLVQNAIKFTKPNGNVWIRSLTAGSRVQIKVEDECGGLPPGKIEELFQPFTQKGEDRSGIGLGLSISRRAIALNHGEISAEDLPGRGCIFTIELPLCLDSLQESYDHSLE